MSYQVEGVIGVGNQCTGLSLCRGAAHKGALHQNNCNCLDFGSSFGPTEQRRTREISYWDQNTLAVVIIYSRSSPLMDIRHSIKSCHLWKSCHIYMGHDTYECIISHMNFATPITPTTRRVGYQDVLHIRR